LLIVADEPTRPQVPLWQLKPFDRVTLSNGNKHDVDPVRIPAGTDFRQVPDDEYVGQPGLPPRSEIRRTLRYRIHRQADGNDYDIYGRNIDKIELYEDMLLAQARKHLREDLFDDSYRYLEHLVRLAPNWPGLANLRLELHHREAVRLKIASRWENAFEEFLLAEKESTALTQAAPVDGQPAFVPLSPPIDTQVDDLVNQWIGSFVEKKEWDQARQVLARVEATRPNTPSVARWREKITADASQLRDQGTKAFQDGQFDTAGDLLEEAIARVPSDPQTRSAIETLYQSQGHLRVGLEIAPTFFGGPADWTTADLRAIDLIHQRLVDEIIRDGQTRFESRLLSSIARPDEFLNRRVVIEVAPGRQWTGSGKTVSVLDVQRLWSESCRPDSPFYHPALARLVVAMTIEPPARLTIDFERPQPRPEVWLTLPLVAMTKGPQAGWFGLGPFAVDRRDERSIRYRRNPSFGIENKPVLRQVTERILPQSADRLRALANQEIDLALDLPPKQWSNAANVPQTHVVLRPTPTVFALQFNFRQQFLRDRTVRRAIRYGLDINALMQQLGLAQKGVQRPTAVWPVGSFGYDPSIIPTNSDIVLARTLIEATKKKIGVLPTLRLVHTGSEADRLACERIANNLTRIGLKINVAPFDPRSPVSPLAADLRYVGLTVNDPVFDVMTFLTRDNPTLAEFASPWLRQMLVELVDIPNQSAAREFLPRLHKVLYDDVAVLPLWQYQERWVVSNRVAHLPENIDNVYQGIAEWTVRPGFPPDPTAAEPATAGRR
jgi:tetratricopeptide (TPR) repeat protein